MSNKEVKELRKSGKLKEAFEMAKSELDKDPENIWNKRAIAWVYYDYLKKNCSQEKNDNFIKILTQLKELNFPSNENMIFDKSAFLIGKFLFDISQNENKIDYNIVNTVFELIKDFHFTKPSDAYSFLHKAFLKCYKKSKFYIEFANWWNFENFQEADFLEEEFSGNKTMSIVEQAYNDYSKNLLENRKCVTDNENINSNDEIAKFITKLDKIIKEHSNYQYPIYYKVQLLLALGRNEEALTNFIPFVKRKKNDYWAWDLLSDIFDNEKEKVACLCKALSMRTPDNFLVKIRQKLAKILIQQNKFSEAKAEVEKILQVYSENEWKIPNTVSSWTQQDWYKNNKSYDNNFAFYKKHKGIAEEILFADIPEEIIVVDFVNKNKSVLNFVQNKSKFGFFKYAGMVDTPKVGDILKVRFNKNVQDKYYKVYSIKKMPDDTPCSVIRNFKGSIRITTDSNFGFVEDVFIAPALVKENVVINRDIISGTAILSFNKKKNEWGWKALTINNQKYQ